MEGEKICVEKKKKDLAKIKTTGTNKEREKKDKRNRVLYVQHIHYS